MAQRLCPWDMAAIQGESGARRRAAGSLLLYWLRYFLTCFGFFAVNTDDRSDTAASRVPSGSSPHRCSIVDRIDVVSCSVLSTANLCFRCGAITSVGTRVPGPQMSCGPLLLP